MNIIIAIIFIIILMKINDKKLFFVIKSKFHPCLIGILIAIINISLGSKNNITLNPAHDLGARIFLSLIGWGKVAFTGSNNSYFPYFLIPIISSIFGINLGGWIYKKFIKN